MPDYEKYKDNPKLLSEKVEQNQRNIEYLQENTDPSNSSAIDNLEEKKVAIFPDTTTNLKELSNNWKISTDAYVQNQILPFTPKINNLEEKLVIESLDIDAPYKKLKTTNGLVGSSILNNIRNTIDKLDQLEEDFHNSQPQNNITWLSGYRDWQGNQALTYTNGKYSTNLAGLIANDNNPFDFKNGTRLNVVCKLQIQNKELLFEKELITTSTGLNTNMLILINDEDYYLNGRIDTNGILTLDIEPDAQIGTITIQRLGEAIFAPATNVASKSEVALKQDKKFLDSPTAQKTITGSIKDLDAIIKEESASLEMDISNNRNDINTNKANITDNIQNLAANAANITINKTDIATNKSAIATNKASINLKANKTDIPQWKDLTNINQLTDNIKKFRVTFDYDGIQYTTLSLYTKSNIETYSFMTTFFLDGNEIARLGWNSDEGIREVKVYPNWNDNNQSTKASLIKIEIQE